MSYFENHLLEIAEQIDINSFNYDNFKRDFNIVREYVFNKMLLVDNNFATIFSGYKLFGSYGNNIRIHCPNEYDVLMQLNFPSYERIKNIQDCERPGFVHLDFSNVISDMEYKRNHTYDYGVDDEFIEFVSEDLTANYNQLLDRASLQTWLHHVFLNAFNAYGRKVIGCQGNQYNLSYRWRGIAYTVTAKSSERTFSIDFVPGVIYGSSNNSWWAVPKLKRGPMDTKDYTFLISDPVAETYKLNNIPQKENLKIVLRLLQSLRNEKNLLKLRCYFLVTVCLWEIKNQNYTFWFKPVSELLVHMIYELGNYFQNGFLPYFWDNNLNLLSNFNYSELEHYENVLKCCYNTLSTYDQQPNLTFGRTASHFDV